MATIPPAPPPPTAMSPTKKVTGWILFTVILLFVIGMGSATVKQAHFAATPDGVAADLAKLRSVKELKELSLRSQELDNAAASIQLEKERIRLKRDELNNGN